MGTSWECHQLVYQYWLPHIQNTTLWLFNITMVKMAHRNKWFTYQKMVVFHGYVK
jgi:hypothetical protein